MRSFIWASYTGSCSISLPQKYSVRVPLCRQIKLSQKQIPHVQVHPKPLPKMTDLLHLNQAQELVHDPHCPFFRPPHPRLCHSLTLALKSLLQPHPRRVSLLETIHFNLGYNATILFAIFYGLPPVDSRNQTIFKFITIFEHQNVGIGLVFIFKRENV
ncbi:ribosomal RNA small subunit methyltransferase I [Striga asiatica]|uniref:Ribosomal RNA small subunit methyltransferase I n=1 Tax=Striga asiatica TaxID=4170 RepID=A0A5A7P5M3_STRAF|nr:ribosomal RNA small subunit methyltransferase I [Striga asiatica]